MESKKFNCKTPNQIGREHQELNIQNDTAYILNRELRNEHKPHYSRGIYVITSEDGKNSIYRKVKGRTWLNLGKDDVILDYGSIADLGGNGDEPPRNITIEKAKGLNSRLKYFNQHPNKDIRMAYHFFFITFWIGVASIILGLLSIACTIFGWTI